MSDSEILLEYVTLVLEKKIREADISDGQKAKWGSKKHVSDLKRRLKDAEYWRDKQKKGSEKRAHYRNVVNDLKRQLSAATKKSEKHDLEEATGIIHQLIDLITEEKELVGKDYSDPNKQKRPGIEVYEKVEKEDGQNNPPAWQPWPSSPISFDFKTPGSGRGEAKLAWLMNGSVMGQNTPWDIQGSSSGAPDGKEAWEVKEPDPQSVIRLGGPSSAKMVSSVLFDMLEVVRMIDAYIEDKSDNMIEIRKSLKEKDEKTLQKFLAEDSTEFKSGNVTKARYNRLLDCINIIKSSLNTEFSSSPNEKPGNKYIEFGDRENSATIKKDVTIKLYKRLATLAGIPEEEIQITEKEKLAQRLDHEAFTNTSAWQEKTDLWSNATALKEPMVDSMKNLTGMILVKNSGYCAVRSEDVNKIFKFEAIAGNRVKFRIVV